MTTKNGESSERLKSIVELRGITQVVDGPKNFLKNFFKTLDFVLI